MHADQHMRSAETDHKAPTNAKAQCPTQRERVPLTQAELAELAGVAEITVRRWEAGLRPQPAHVRRLCAVLDASPAQLGYGPEDDPEPEVAVTKGLGLLSGGSPKQRYETLFESTALARWTGAGLPKTVPTHGIKRQLLFSGGRFFDGAAVVVSLHSAAVTSEGVILTDMDDLQQRDPRPRQLLPELLVGAEEAAGTPRFFVLDRRAARRQLDSGVSGQPGLTVPRGYLLDDLTFGILWATANLDASLLTDDSALTEARRGLRAYDRLRSSAVSREVASDLTSVSQRWLGSEYCARHILRNLEGSSG
jgi:transcriptional regulator with XRE-family HTH domain